MEPFTPRLVVEPTLKLLAVPVELLKFAVPVPLKSIFCGSAVVIENKCIGVAAAGAAAAVAINATTRASLFMVKVEQITRGDQAGTLHPALTVTNSHQPENNANDAPLFFRNKQF